MADSSLRKGARKEPPKEHPEEPKEVVAPYIDLTAVKRDRMRTRKSGMPELQRFTEAEYRPYVAAIGQAALAWNDLNEMLASLFELIVLGGWLNIANSVWHSSTQDRASRAMLKSVLNVVPIRWPRGFPTAADDIKWLLDKVDALEDQRNNIVHAPLWLMRAPNLAKALGKKSKVYPHVMSGNRRAARFEEKDLLDEYRWFREAALTYRDYAGDIQAALEGQIGTWPDRPREPKRGHQNSRRRR